jgi:hypothetical protein
VFVFLAVWPKDIFEHGTLVTVRRLSSVRSFHGHVPESFENVLKVSGVSGEKSQVSEKFQNEYEKISSKVSVRVSEKILWYFSPKFQNVKYRRSKFLQQKTCPGLLGGILAD